MRGREGIEDVVVTETMTCSVSRLTSYFFCQAVTWVMSI